MTDISRSKIYDKINKGTTTVGIVCENSVVLATDTRVTMGFFVAHKLGKKIFQIDNHLAMTIAGVVAEAQNIVEILKANAKLFLLDNGRPISIASASRLTANILFSSRSAPLSMQAIIGGVDETGPHIYAIDPLGSLTEETCFSTGSGSPIAYGVLEDEYKKNMSINAGISLVVRAINSAMKRDIGSGNSFDVAIITKQGYRELTDVEKKQILKTQD